MAQLSTAWILSKEGELAGYFHDAPSLYLTQVSPLLLLGRPLSKT